MVGGSGVPRVAEEVGSGNADQRTDSWPSNARNVDVGGRRCWGYLI